MRAGKAAPRPAKRGKPKRRRGGFLRQLASLLVAALLVFLAYEVVTWPDVRGLAQRDPKTTAFIERYRALQRKVGKDDRVSLVWTDYASISPQLKRAVLVAEDINFFSHHGFDVGEMQNAVAEALDEGEIPRGASTITQQLAKNLFLSPSRNPLRKLEEALLTRQLEGELGKKRIFELYLNVVELGPGIYGCGAAARHYFGKSPADLSAEEAAELAASLPNPSAWHPGSSRRGYARRVALIAGRMEKAKFPAGLL